MKFLHSHKDNKKNNNFDLLSFKLELADLLDKYQVSIVDDCNCYSDFNIEPEFGNITSKLLRE